MAYKITDYLDYEAARFALLKRLEEELESRYFCWRADGEEMGTAFIIRTTDKEAVGKLKHFLEYIKKEEQSRVVAAISKPYKALPGSKEVMWKPGSCLRLPVCPERVLLLPRRGWSCRTRRRRPEKAGTWTT